MYHVITNEHTWSSSTRITPRLHSYWMTVFQTGQAGGSCAGVAAAGRGVDELVRVKGLIGSSSTGDVQPKDD